MPARAQYKRGLEHLLEKVGDHRRIKRPSCLVEIGEVMKHWYPLHPTMPIEEGSKQIVFNPPGELLSGERIHQWMGARISPEEGGSNL